MADEDAVKETQKVAEETLESELKISIFLLVLIFNFGHHPKMTTFGWFHQNDVFFVGFNTSVMFNFQLWAPPEVIISCGAQIAILLSFFPSILGPTKNYNFWCGSSFNYFYRFNLQKLCDERGARA